MALAERAPGIAWVGPFNDSDTLRAEVNRREKANGLAPSSLDVIEDQLCQRLPPGYCVDARGAGTLAPGNLSLSLPDVIHGTLALLRWFLHGSVAPEQIVARSYRCNECPENRPIAGCTGCAASSLHAVMNKIVCKCSLKAKTRMQLSDVLASMDAPMKARLWERCWITAEERGEPLRNDPRT
jgi:hypothetical protein